MVTGFVMGWAPGTVTGGATGLVSGTGELAGTVMGVVKGMDTGVEAGLDGVTVIGLVAGTVMIVGVEVSGVVGKFVVGESVASCIVVRTSSLNFHSNSAEAFSCTSKCDPPNLPEITAEAETFRTETKKKDSPDTKQQNPLNFLRKHETPLVDKMQTFDSEAETRRNQDGIIAENEELS